MTQGKHGTSLLVTCSPQNTNDRNKPYISLLQSRNIIFPRCMITPQTRIACKYLLLSSWSCPILDNWYPSSCIVPFLMNWTNAPQDPKLGRIIHTQTTREATSPFLSLTNEPIVKMLWFWSHAKNIVKLEFYVIWCLYTRQIIREKYRYSP